MKVIAKNRRASFDYAIEQRLLAGIVLKGHEAKSVRAGAVSLKGSFVSVKDNQLWVHNMHISPYPHASLDAYDPTATRKLLAHGSEIKRLIADKQNGLHIIPTAIGAQGRYLKLEIGIGPSQKRVDKRNKIKTKDTNIDTQRALKNWRD